MFGCVSYFVVECDGSCCVYLEVLYWIDNVWSSIECVCSACGPSECLDAPSICFCMSEVISSFRSLRTGSQVFAHLMLFLCVIVHIMSSGKSLQLLWIFPFGMLCLSAISMMFVKIRLAVCMVVWAKRMSVGCVVVMSFVNCGDDG